MAERLVGMMENCDYKAVVIFDGGQVEEYQLGDHVIFAAPYENKIELLCSDGRTIAINWTKVIRIDYVPQGRKKVTRAFSEELAAKLLALPGNTDEGPSYR